MMAGDLAAGGFTDVLLPHGLWDEDGVCHRDAVLRPLTGREEGALGGPRPLGLRALLASTVERIGAYDEVHAKLVASLTRGDLRFLTLHLRAAMFGDRVALVVPCPNPSCRELADMELSIDAIAPPRSSGAAETITVETPDGAAVLREPTGADDDAVAAMDGDRRARAALLWSRIVIDLGGRGAPSPEAWAALSAATRHAIALALAERQAAPDLVFLARCPSCSALIELELDPAALLFKELRMGAERLFAEVHCLAWYYHWSEAEILALTRARRWRYLELVRRQVEGRALLDIGG